MSETITQWTGCYDSNWNELIVPEAFGHPAKMARGLLERIYAHLFEHGHLRPDDCVVDPFGGVGTTGLIGSYLGVKCFACELEPKFHALALENYKLHAPKWDRLGLHQPEIVCGDSRNLRANLAGVMAAGIVSSLPYAETSVTAGNAGSATDALWGKGVSLSASNGYGSSDGNLGNLPPGNVAAVVSSPPFMEASKGGGISAAMRGEGSYNVTTSLPTNCYQPSEQGITEGNLANAESETFWSASRLIVSESLAILRPGGVAVWVCKDFVRDKKRVPFSDDWQRLCLATGFELVERIHASLVKEDAAPSLFGGLDVKRKERKSFFRRLAEKKGSPRIDHEDVIIVRKPMDGMGGGAAAAVVSSPPFMENNVNIGAVGDTPAMRQQIHQSTKRDNSYGSTTGQLGLMRPGTLGD